MGTFCLQMLGIALDLATRDIVYEDMASKFFEHFIMIVDAMNGLNGKRASANVKLDIDSPFVKL